MIAIYARQSIDKKDSISIESQIEKCKNEALDSEEIKIYQDKGFSGKNTDRPMFTQMITDIKNGIISKVIVYKIDRISRAIVDFGKIMELFDKYKVEFISYTEKFDTTSPIGNAMLNIIMVFAQLERETIQLRVKDNYYDRGKQGYYLGGKAPYGYTKIETRLSGKKTYTFEEEKGKAEIVKDLYEQYASTDISLGKLIEYLNRNKINTDFGNPWSSVSLGRLLRNPIYVMSDVDVYMYLKNKGATINNDIDEFIGQNGCYLYAERHNVTTSKFTDLSNSFVTIGLHKGIISSDIWLKCQYKLDQNKQLKNSGKGTHSWLSGIMKCGYCGLAINVVNNSRGNNYINCGGRKLRVCYERKRVIHVEDIEGAVEIKLLNYMHNYKVKLQENTFFQEDSVQVNQLKMKLVQIENKIQNLMDALADGNSTLLKYLNENIKKLDDEKNKILNQINDSMKNKSSKNDISSSDLDEYSKNWNNYNIEKKKSVAKKFIVEVIVTDDNIHVQFTD